MEEINLIELWNYFKNKIMWIIVTCIFIIICGNAFMLLTRVPEYQSVTTIVLVNENKDNYNTSELQLNKGLVGTYSEIIKSRKVLNKVINNLDIDRTVNELSENISVSSVEDTEIIKIVVSDTDSKLAAEIANETAEVFMKEIQKIYSLDNVSVVDQALEAKAPYNINFVKDNVIYLLVGLVLSCGVIFVMFYFDTTIKSGEEIESKLVLTVIGIVPNEEE